MGEALAKGEAERAAMSAARAASPVSSKRAGARTEREGRVEATAIDCGEVRSERLQENLRKVNDERRREANRKIRSSAEQLAEFRMDAEEFGAGVDAHRWANGTAECFEIVGKDSSDDEGADFST